MQASLTHYRHFPCRSFSYRLLILLLLLSLYLFIGCAGDYPHILKHDIRFHSVPSDSYNGLRDDYDSGGITPHLDGKILNNDLGTASNKDSQPITKNDSGFIKKDLGSIANNCSLFNDWSCQNYPASGGACMTSCSSNVLICSEVGLGLVMCSCQTSNGSSYSCSGFSLNQGCGYCQQALQSNCCHL